MHVKIVFRLSYNFNLPKRKITGFGDPPNSIKVPGVSKIAFDNALPSNEIKKKSCFRVDKHLK